MEIFKSVVTFVLLFVIILIAFSACKMYLFKKIRINKYIPLAIGVVLFILQLLFAKGNRILNYALSILAVLFFLWFIDIMQTGGPKKKEKNITIRPKAKPNRVKNRKNK